MPGVQNQVSQNTTNSNNNATHSPSAGANIANAPMVQSTGATISVQSSTIQNSSQLPDVDQTAMCEYLNLVQSEYSIERGKKESFENRAGIIMALIGALLVFTLDKLPLNDVVKLCKDPLTFVVLTKIILGFSSYITLFASLLFSFLTITTSKQENYPVNCINLSYLAEQKKDAIARITITYKDIIIAHRKHNEKRASKFKFSLILSIISICCFIAYSLMK